MGTIDYDPTSDPVQQCIVDATSVPSIEINPLQEHWHGNVFVAAKGAVKNSRLWFYKTLDEYRNGHIDQFVFFTNASELMRAAPALLDYPFCIPFKRVKQLRADRGGFEEISPSTWNIIVYGPPIEAAMSSVDKIKVFQDTFRDIGRVCFNEWAGDNWFRDYENYKEKKGDV